MKKDAYYFPHYSNARNDIKLRRLRKSLGLEGYAIYFMILEVLRDQSGFKYPINDIDLLSEDLSVEQSIIIKIISDFELFKTENDMFFSEKNIQFLSSYIEKSSRARDAANKRWGENRSNSMQKDMQMHMQKDMHLHCSSNADQNAINKLINKVTPENANAYANASKEENTYFIDNKVIDKDFDDYKNNHVDVLPWWEDNDTTK